MGKMRQLLERLGLVRQAEPEIDTRGWTKSDWDAVREQHRARAGAEELRQESQREEALDRMEAEGIAKRQKAVRFHDTDCVAVAERYASSGHTAVSLYDARDSRPVATATLNLPWVPLRPDQVFIKDYSENEGMLAALEQAGVVRAMGVYVPTGVGSLPVCELLIEPPEPEKGRERQEPLPGNALAEPSCEPPRQRDRGMEMEL